MRRLSMSEGSVLLERVSEEVIREVIRRCSNPSAPQGELSREQVRRICEEVLLYRAEDRLRRAFLTSILEYHDYAYDEVSPEAVLRGIEQRAKALNAQLAVS